MVNPGKRPPPKNAHAVGAVLKVTPPPPLWPLTQLPWAARHPLPTVVGIATSSSRQCDELCEVNVSLFPRRVLTSVLITDPLTALGKTKRNEWPSPSMGFITDFE
jgi:hypothetical protein